MMESDYVVRSVTVNGVAVSNTAPRHTCRMNEKTWLHFVLESVKAGRPADFNVPPTYLFGYRVEICADIPDWGVEFTSDGRVHVETINII